MKQKILIIDDDQDFVETTSLVLGAEGYDVIGAANGGEGMARVRSESPGLILLDMAMTYRQEGAEIARALASDAALRSIPVIMVTAMSGEIKRHAEEYGDLPVKEILEKPLDPALLIERIRLHIAKDGGEQNAQLVEDLQAIVEKWKDRQGNLIMILHAVENKYGYVPRAVAFHLARMIDMPLAQIYEVITFYNYFKLEKPGAYTISVCMGTACYLQGANDVLEALKHQLQVEEGGTTSDGLFTLETVRCIGCCGLAPVITINGKVYGKLKKDDVAGIISQYVAGAHAAQA